MTPNKKTFKTLKPGSAQTGRDGASGKFLRRTFDPVEIIITMISV